MADTTLTDERVIDVALSRSVLYSAVAAALGKPAKDSLERVYGETASAVLLDAARFVDGLDGEMSPNPAAESTSAAPGATVAPIVPTVLTMTRAVRQATLEELEESYQRLFGHTARGKVPPYETEYGRQEIFRQSQELADINGFYNAFGLTLVRSEFERSDHVSAECEFLSFLTSKEAQTLTAGDRESWEQARSAGKLFLKEHLGCFGRAFARSLMKEAAHPFYRAAGTLCFDFLTADCRYLGVPPGAEFIQLRSTKEADVPMACSSCSLMQNSPPSPAP